MSFMTTAHGIELSMQYPTPASITLADIGHHLSQINRFTGAARRPYSVAEHSLLVCEIAERELHLPVEARFAALMHDAHEAYTNDLHSPGKGEVGTAWHDFEGRFERLTRRVFGLTHAFADHAAAIKRADLMALATEREQLLPRTPTPWECLDGIQPVPWVDLMERGRASFSWDDWRRAFIDRADELDFARGLRTGAAQ